MEITRANLADVKELDKLVNSAYRGEDSKKGWTTEAEILDGIRIDEKALEIMLAKPGLTILKVIDGNGKILGTVCLEVEPNELHLGMFAVSPLSQGNGMGKSLLMAAEDHALENNCAKIVISVISTRVELINWYGRHGYLPTGGSIAFDEIEGRFGDPKVEAISLIEMEKVLGD
ncbi:GNAT family N-acetyltransferase [Pedobacter frigiditerrae]|uniref:GNAT family N-acetyltransferase n=1 Tax=Pedobacter frigiditerrae TaxID=2530452 RepID=A0A4R0MPE6_9SPHI|nr:GNAT family N-acetyltransferase [Pedobacter frigiditerrae]TCC88493.1 GNAT family N-acetyltransferase [Pedobacter frigiditerrae]